MQLRAHEMDPCAHHMCVSFDSGASRLWIPSHWPTEGSGSTARAPRPAFSSARPCPGASPACCSGATLSLFLPPPEPRAGLSPRCPWERVPGATRDAGVRPRGRVAPPESMRGSASAGLTSAPDLAAAARRLKGARGLLTAPKGPSPHCSHGCVCVKLLVCVCVCVSASVSVLCVCA